MPAGAFIKQNAKGCLRRHWGPAIGVFFIFVIIYMLRSVSEEVLRLAAGIPLDYTFNISGFVSGLPGTLGLLNLNSLVITLSFMVFGLLVFSPLTLGVKRYFWNLTGEKPSGVGCVFDFYSSSALYLRSVALSLRIAVQTLFAGVLFLLPAGILLALSYLFRSGSFGFLQSQSLSGMMFSFAGLAAFCGLLFLALYYQRFFLAGYFIAADDELEVGDAVEYSAAWMHGHTLRLVSFLFSFFFWYLLCLLVLPVIFVYPYVNASFAGFARGVILDHHKRAEYYGGQGQAVSGAGEAQVLSAGAGAQAADGEGF